MITSKIPPQGFTPTALLKNELKNYVQQFSYKSHLLKQVYGKNESKEDNSFDDSKSTKVTPNSNFSKLEWETINDLRNDNNLKTKDGWVDLW